MGSTTSIEWCDKTFNGWIGCTKVGPGCDNCYAAARDDRFSKGVHWGPGQARHRTSPDNWKLPIRWNKEAERLGIRYRVFCASLADVFDNEIDPEWRADLFELIAATPNLDWLLLTKRIGNANDMICEAVLARDLDISYGPLPWPNIWLGATIVNQEEADRDISKLLKIPAAVHFLSVEPLLGPVDLTYTDNSDGMLVQKMYGIDQIIVGGESGPGARVMITQWARSLRDQCKEYGVAFFMKQMGGPVKRSMPIIPPDLMIREFPKGLEV